MRKAQGRQGSCSRLQQLQQSLKCQALPLHLPWSPSSLQKPHQHQQQKQRQLRQCHLQQSLNR
eukprot:scaffold88187_cov14-Tisochrysis_lutea.AAC.1